jgi:hypothetical protein
VEARRQLHYAALLVASVGRSLGPREPGFRHAALYWARDRTALVGWMLTTGTGERLRAELSFAPPGLGFSDWSVPLLEGASSATFDDAWTGLGDAVGRAGLAAGTLTRKLPKDLEDHALSSGARFSVPAQAAAALGRWFSYGDEVLAGQAKTHDSPLPVACWGDHFDMSVVVPTGDDESVTLGFSPGDDSIEEPYLYVLPYPVPSGGRLPGAPTGARWHTKGWVGLALHGTTIAAATDPVAAGRAFLDEGLEIAQDVLLRTP